MPASSRCGTPSAAARLTSRARPSGIKAHTGAFLGTWLSCSKSWRPRSTRRLPSFGHLASAALLSFFPGLSGHPFPSSACLLLSLPNFTRDSVYPRVPFFLLSLPPSCSLCSLPALPPSEHLHTFYEHSREQTRSNLSPPLSFFFFYGHAYCASLGPTLVHFSQLFTRRLHLRKFFQASNSFDPK